MSERAGVQEASIRAAARGVFEILRLPNGEFAPKGRGKVLYARDEVRVGNLRGRVLGNRTARLSNGTTIRLAPAALQRLSPREAARAATRPAPNGRPTARLRPHPQTGAFGEAHARTIRDALESTGRADFDTPRGAVSVRHLGNGEHVAHVPGHPLVAGRRHAVAREITKALNAPRQGAHAPAVTAAQRRAFRSLSPEARARYGSAQEFARRTGPQPHARADIAPAGMASPSEVPDIGGPLPAEDPGLVALTAGGSPTRTESSHVDGTAHHVAMVNGRVVGVFSSEDEARQHADDMHVLSRIERQLGMATPGEWVPVGYWDHAASPLGPQSLHPGDDVRWANDRGGYTEGKAVEFDPDPPGQWRVRGPDGEQMVGLSDLERRGGMPSPGEPTIFERLAEVQFTGKTSDPDPQGLVDAGYIAEDKLQPGRYSLTAKGSQEWKRLPREARIEIGKKFRGMASPGETLDKEKVKATIKEARASKSRFPTDSKLEGMEDIDIAAWTIARNPSNYLANAEYNELKARRAALLARPELAKAKTVADAADPFRRVVAGLKPGENAKLPDGTVLKRYKDRGWGRPNYSIQTPGGKPTSRSNKTIATRAALATASGSKGLGMATPGEGPPRAPNTRMVPGVGMVMNHAKAGERLSKHDGYHLEAGDKVKLLDGRVGKIQSTSNAGFQGILSHVRLSNGETRYNVHSSQIVATPELVHRIAERSPGMHSPSEAPEPSPDVNVALRRLTGGMHSPGETPEMAPDWAFIEKMQRQQGTLNPVGTLEDLAQAWGGADPELHKDLLDAIDAGRRARRGGMPSPGEVPSEGTRLDDIVKDAPGAPGSTTRDLAKPGDLPEGTLLYSSSLPTNPARLGGPAGEDDYGPRYAVQGLDGTKGTVPANQFYPVAAFTEADWNALPKGEDGAPLPDTDYQAMAADGGHSEGVRALAREFASRRAFRERQAARRADPLGGYGVDFEEARQRVQARIDAGTAGPADDQLLTDLGDDMADDMVKNDLRGDPFIAAGLRDRLGQLEQLQNRIRGNDSATGAYTDAENLVDRRRDLEDEGPDFEQMGMYSPGEPDNGPDGTTDPLKAWLSTPMAYEITLTRHAGELNRFGDTQLPNGARVSRAPNGWRVEAGGGAGVVQGDTMGALSVADALERAPQPWLGELRDAWRRYSSGKATKDDGRTINELAGGKALYTVMASPGEKTLPDGYEPNTAATELGELPDGQLFATVDGFTYVKHKNTGGAFVITKPVDAAGNIVGSDPHPGKSHGKTTRVLHQKMAVGGIGPVAPGYADHYDASPAPDPPKLTPNGWQPGDPNPARGKSGGLRNFHAMKDDKLAALAAVMQGHPDAEATTAINAEMQKRGLTPHGSVAQAMPTHPSAAQEDLYDKLAASVDQAATAPATAPEPAAPGANFGMFSDEGNAAAEKLVDAVAAAPPTKRQAMLDAGMTTIAGFHPEVHDTAVEDEIHAALKRRGVPMSDTRLKLAGPEAAPEPPAPTPAPAAPGVPSPARSKKGNLRNFKQMKDEKLTELADQMDGHPDAEAVGAINEELGKRGLPTIQTEDGQLESAGLPAAPLPKPVAPPGGPEPSDFESEQAASAYDALEAPGDTKELPNGTKVVQTGNGFVITGPHLDKPELSADKLYAVNRAAELDSTATAPGAGVSGTLSDAAATLGDEWTAGDVEAALQKLEAQGIPLDASVETPATLAAVISAAGLKPTGIETTAATGVEV